jgi:hypothetical protein
MTQGFDASLEDIGMDLNAEIEAADAAEAGGGGPMANRFSRPFVERTSSYVAPVSQPAARTISAPYNDIIGSEAGLQAVVDAVKTGVEQAIGTTSAPYDDIIGSYSGLNKARIANSEMEMRADIAALKDKIGNLLQSITPEEGWASKINDAVQAFNPMRSDWAQENLYGTPVTETSVAYLGPTKPTVGEYQKAVDWARKNFPEDVQSSTPLSQQTGVFETASTGTLSPAQQNQALIEQAILEEQMPTQNLDSILNKLAGDTVATEEEAAAIQARLNKQQADAWANLLSEEDIPGVTSTQGTPISPVAQQVTFGGYPKQIGPSSLVNQLDEDTVMTEEEAAALQDNLSKQQADAWANLLAEESQGLLTGAALAEETLGAPGGWYGGTPIDANEFAISGDPAFQDFQTLDQNVIDIATGVDSFSGMPVTTQATGDPLEDKQSYMDLIDALKAQPIGSSPIAQQYTDVFQGGSDFPQNPGFGIGTQGFKPGDEEFAYFNEDGQLVITITGNPEDDLVIGDEEFEDGDITDGSQPSITIEEVEEVLPDATPDKMTEEITKALNKKASDDLKKSKTKTETKSKYGTWDGLFNKKTAKQNQEALLTHNKAWMSDFDEWAKTASQKEINEMKRTDKYSKVYAAVHGTNKAIQLVSGALSAGVGTVGSMLQGFFNKKGAGNADTFKQTLDKMQDGEFKNTAELPPSHPKDKVSGGHWGLINFAKKHPKIFGSLSGDELWSLVSTPDDFWAFYEAGLAGE